MLPENSYLVFDNQQISSAIDVLAEKLNIALADEKPLVLCVMQGGLVFSGQLIPRLNFMLEIDYIHVTRYQNTTQGYGVNWKAEPVSKLKNRVILILDDILDEGLTLKEIIDYCKKQGAKKIVSAVLLRKNHNRCDKETTADYIALQVEDRYVFGYGMDLNSQYRQLDSIYALEQAE